MSACAWAYARSVPNGSEAVIIANNNDAALQYSLEIESDRSVGLFWSEEGTGFIRELITGAAAISFNAWNHLCAVRQSAGDAGTIYINGVAQSTTVDPGPVELTPGGTARIGEGAPSLNQDWDGFIDDVRLYNRILTPDEIKRLYKMGSTAKVGVATNNGSLAQGLVGYWTFDGKDVIGVTAYDRSGQGNNGTLTNGPSRAIGKIGQALDFDGTSGYVVTPTISNLSSIITVSFWLNWDIYVNDEDIAIESSVDSTANDNAILIDPNASAPAGSAGRFAFGIHTGDFRYESFVRPSAGMFHHYSLIFDNSTSAGDVYAYVDGVLQATTLDKDLKTASGNLGSYSWYLMSRAGTSLFGAGILDDVRIYNRALSADEVKRLYLMGR